MKLEQARKRLFDRNVLFGGRRRRAAAWVLAAAPGTDEVHRLLVALARRYLKPSDLVAALRQGPPQAKAAKVEAMWRAYADAPHPALAAALVELGWPAAREVPPEIAQSVLGAAVEDAPAPMLQAAALLAQPLPVDDEGLNDAIAEAWSRSASPALRPLVFDERRRYGVAGLTTLARAMGGADRDDEAIAGVLRRLGSAEHEEKTPALWSCLAPAAEPTLAAVLAELGWPDARPVPAGMAREVLNLALGGADERVLNAVAALARALPLDDEAVNDGLYGAWVRSQSGALEAALIEQGRQPTKPALEALLALVSGRLERYAALDDGDGHLLVQAFALAPEAFRARLAQTVAASQDRAITAAYRRALQTGGVDPAQAAENLAMVGDEDGLFEQTRFLNLIQLLALCERWAVSGVRPSQPKYRAAADAAVEIYRALGELPGESAPALPDGMVDLLDYWRAEAPSDAVLRADLAEEDPFYQARAFYLGLERGLVDAARIARAPKSPHWPVRLLSRLLDPSSITEGKEDHVIWVNAGADHAPLLMTPVGASPEDYDRNLAESKRAAERGAARTQALLQILCTFQGVFVAGGITVADTAAAVDSRAVEVEDAGDVKP